MRYVKKTCILRQLKNGFSADGNPISGIVKVEQYARHIGLEFSTANLAALSEGEYHLLLADSDKRYKLFPLGDGRYSFQGELQLAAGFYTAICYVNDGAEPIAYGVCGNMPYDLFSLVRTAFSSPQALQATTPPPVINADLPSSYPKMRPIYDDELVAGDNYFEKEKNYAHSAPTQACENAPAESGNPHQKTPQRDDPDQDENDEGIRHAFTTQSDGYYQSIKGELTALFARYPQDETLNDAYPASEWVRIRGTEGKAEELVGLIYESGLVKYICYAVPAMDNAPQEIREKAYFVPLSPLTPEVGFYVLYQSAATGESIIKKEL